MVLKLTVAARWLVLVSPLSILRGTAFLLPVSIDDCLSLPCASNINRSTYSDTLVRKYKVHAYMKMNIQKDFILPTRVY